VRSETSAIVLNLGDKQLAELAFQGLLLTLREKYASHDFESQPIG
jgi:hypothetical protein